VASAALDVLRIEEGIIVIDHPDARNEDNYTIREWVEAPGVRYVPVDGELELLPGLRLVPAPGHTRGLQVVVVETGGRPVVVGGDVAVWFGELDEPHAEGQLRALTRPRAGLAHARGRAVATPHRLTLLCHLRSGALQRKLSSMPRSRRLS
jgi:glyoxylase-like metal-dependent hydrolase (beta-lactamase superfamily II)